MNQILLSIIVPVYRVEKYVVECIHSIIKQLDEDFELIIVNDGSPDHSAELIEAYLAEIKNPELRARIHLIHQENQGLSVARNNGIALSQGQYLAFVDSDDLWTDHAAQIIRQMLTRRDRSEIELFCFSVDLFDESLNQTAHLVELPQIPRLPEIITDNPIRLLLTNSAWTKVFSRKLLDSHQIRFPKGLAFEDIYVTFLAALHAKMVAVSDESIYRYRINSTSYMQTFPKKTARDLLTVIIKLKDYILASEYAELLTYLEFKAISDCYLLYQWKLHGSEDRELKAELLADFEREFPEFRKNPHLSFLKGRLKLRFYAARFHLTPVLKWILLFGSKVKVKLRKSFGK